MRVFDDVLDVRKVQKMRWLTLVWQIIIGTATSFSYVLVVYVGPLHETYGWGIGKILLTFTLSLWIGSPAMIIGGKIRDKLGNKKSIVIGGFLYGIAFVVSAVVTNVYAFVIIQGGIASLFTFLVYLSQLHNVGILFPDKRGLATGLLIGGMSLGSGLMMPFATYLIGEFSVRTSLTVQGILYGAIIVIFGLMIINAPDGFKPKGFQEQEEDLNSKEDFGIGASGLDLNWRKMLMTPAFWLLFISFILVSIMSNMIASNGSLMAQDATGATETQAAWMVSAGAFACGIGGIVMGFIADKIGVLKTIAASTLLNGVIVLAGVIIGIEKYAIFVALVLVINFMFGAAGTLMPVITMNAFGEKNFGVNYGIIGLNVMVASLLAPQLTVILPVKSCFVLGGITAIIAVIAVIAAMKSITRLAKKQFAVEEAQA